jgi:chorismate-pyruvate lyase
MSDSSLADVSLSLQQQVLLTTDGTVTDLVALFSGEEIHITKIAQRAVVSTGPAELGLSKAEPLLERSILLSGASRHYLYAQSHFVIQRLAPDMQRELLETETPIGLLWKKARLEMYREVVDRRLENRPELLDYFPDAADARFVSRTYVVYHNAKPLGVITEKFPLDFFRNQTPDT